MIIYILDVLILLFIRITDYYVLILKFIIIIYNNKINLYLSNTKIFLNKKIYKKIT